MEGQLPVTKLPSRLIVLWAFDLGEDGALVPAWEAREMPDERRAINAARDLAQRHVGVICWARDANPAEGTYGPSEVLFQQGSIPDLD